MSIQYRLYPNPVKAGKTTYRALVSNRWPVDYDEIIRDMTRRGSALTRAEVLGVMQTFMEVIEEKLEEGRSVNTPLFKAQPSISGIFNSLVDVFHPSRHKINIKISVGSGLKKRSAGFKAKKIKPNRPSPNIISVIDYVSEQKDSRITPGGMCGVKGLRLKIDIDDPEQGVFFIGDENDYKADKFVVNYPTELLFLVPPGMEAGEYKIEIRNKQRAKDIRKDRFEKVLVVASS